MESKTRLNEENLKTYIEPQANLIKRIGDLKPKTQNETAKNFIAMVKSFRK